MPVHGTAEGTVAVRNNIQAKLGHRREFDFFFFTHAKRVILRNGGLKCYIITTLSVAVYFRQTDPYTISTLKPILAFMQEHRRKTSHKHYTEILVSAACAWMNVVQP